MTSDKSKLHSQLKAFPTLQQQQQHANTPASIASMVQLLLASSYILKLVVGCYFYGSLLFYAVHLCRLNSRVRRTLLHTQLLHPSSAFSRGASRTNQFTTTAVHRFDSTHEPNAAVV